MIMDILAGLLSGMLGAMGLGGGGILILYLTLIKDTPQLKAQGINLIFFIPIGIIALLLHNKNNLVDWTKAIRLTIAGFIGLIPGYYLTTVADENLLRKIFAVLLIIVGTKNILRKNKERLN